MPELKTAEISDEAPMVDTGNIHPKYKRFVNVSHFIKTPLVFHGSFKYSIASTVTDYIIGY